MTTDERKIQERIAAVVAGRDKRITELKSRIEGQQYEIDTLMLEYCPEEMTRKQKDNWAKNQVSLVSGDKVEDG